ncbi:MFS transporter [Kribbella antibiotica]|uniref:MFS transporter n=1 Tax=Kribbella antibiotica TaxID=190195 RepID=A0A4R4Z2D3_9ACTN|nr:MFS transporter [Kribbella antibiotica]TDD52128.1 MFS transporter [Kribbella antibiotica]
MLTRYLTAATLARVGAEMVAFTLVLLVLDRTDSPALAGLTGAAYALPAVVTGPLLGAWLDRTAHRRTVLAVSQAVMGGVVLALLVVTPHWAAPVLAAVAGTTLPLVNGGFTSMLPSLVSKDQLPQANSFEAASFGLAAITGPAAAATVTAIASAETAVVVIAALAALSILAIGRLPVLPPAGRSQDPFLRSVLGGLTHLARTPRLRASTVTSTLLMGVIGMLLITLPLHMASLGMPRSAAGYLWTAMELGSVATALLLGRRLTRWRPECVVMLSVAAYGLAFTAWPLAGTFATLLILAAVTGLLDGPMIPAMFAARQQYSSLELQGRVSTTAASLRVGVAALGQVAAGVLVPVIGTHAALLVIAGSLVGASALGWLSLKIGRNPEAPTDFVRTQSRPWT